MGRCRYWLAGSFGGIASADVFRRTAEYHGRRVFPAYESNLPSATGICRRFEFGGSKSAG